LRPVSGKTHTLSKNNKYTPLTPCHKHNNQKHFNHAENTTTDIDYNNKPRHTNITHSAHTKKPIFPLIRLLLIFTLASILIYPPILFSILLKLSPNVTDTFKRRMPLPQHTILPPLTYSGERKKRPRPPGTPASTPDPQKKTTPTSSVADKNKNKRQKHQSRDKKDVVRTEKRTKKQKVTNTSQQKNTFFTINIQGLTKRKWTALLAQDPDELIITEHRLPFTHTPSYVKQTGWVFQVHTIQSQFKKDKQGLPTTTSSGQPGVLLAIRQDTFAVTQKKHYEQDQYQAATWTLKSGTFIPHIHITGMYISPDPLLPNSEIKQLYATLNTDFHPPSSPSSQNTHADHNHIYTGDFNSWTGTALEDHLPGSVDPE